MRPIVLPLLLALLPACSRAPEKAAPKGSAPVPVNVAPVETRDIPFDLSAVATVESIASVEIKAQVPGALIAVNFEEGQEVAEGDLLFTIQPKLYEVQLQQAEANLARDRATAANARRDATRLEELGVKGGVSAGQLDQARSTAEAAEAAVKADEALVEIAGVRLGYTTIESPINGRTGAILERPGSLIKDNADTPLVTVSQMAPIYVRFALPEKYLAEIRERQKAGPLAVTATDTHSGTVLGEGSLTFLDTTVDRTTGTILLKATFPNADRALWPGAFVEARLHLRVDRGVTVVPSPAIATGQRGPQAFVLQPDGTAALRPVEIERITGGETIVRKGLTPGEQVVVNGQSRLIPGAAVVVKPVAGDTTLATPEQKGGAR